MSPDKNRSAGPRVRLAIARWPDDAPRGAVTTFCAEQGISRKTLLRLAPARAGGRGPRRCSSPGRAVRDAGPSRLPDRVRARALDVRAAPGALGTGATVRSARAGKDGRHGPRGALAGVPGQDLPSGGGGQGRTVQETEGGVAPVRPAPPPTPAGGPGCRRVRPGRRAQGGDLAGSRTTTPAWRWPPWSPRAMAGQAAIDVFDKGVAARGVPQRLLTDNGAALNPSRRGVTGRLVEHVRSPGVEPITGRPYRPTTQGKNERFHQTLLRYLDQQPLADSIAEPQEQVDRFDHTLQHPAPPPGPARAHHPAAGLGRRRGGPGTPTGPRHRPHHPRRRTRARRARRAPTAAPAQAHRPQRRARSRPSPATAPSTSAASRSWSAAPWPGTEPPRSGTPPPSPSPTSTARS